MSREALTQLRAELDSARRKRDGARWRVSQIRAEAQDLEEQARGYQAQADAAQENHDKKQRLANRSYRANQGDKARRRVARRNAYGAEARLAREVRDRLNADARVLQERAEILSRELGLAALNLEYVVARHHLMEWIAANEDETDKAQKAEYCRSANIPPFYEDEQVRYYTDLDTHGEVVAVHLFYGGSVSPTGQGESPDGLGHAHHQLERIDNRLDLTFARYLDGSIFRLGSADAE